MISLGFAIAAVIVILSLYLVVMLTLEVVRKRLTDPRREDAWTSGYKDMAWAVRKKLTGTSMPDEAYKREGKRIIAENYVFEALIRHPEKIREFDPADGRTSRYISAPAKKWNAYREGGMKFLDDLDEYQGIALARKAQIAEEDKRYKKTKAELDKIREENYRPKNEKEEFDRQMRELDE